MSRISHILCSLWKQQKWKMPLLSYLISPRYALAVSISGKSKWGETQRSNAGGSDQWVNTNNREESRSNVNRQEGTFFPFTPLYFGKEKKYFRQLRYQQFNLLCSLRFEKVIYIIFQKEQKRKYCKLTSLSGNSLWTWNLR